MRVLLDTHAFLWALYTPERLSPQARAMVEEPSNIRLISAATAWEIVTKARLGKLAGVDALLAGYREHLKTFRAEELVVTSEDALLAGSFPQAHRDPVDRMLAAQSLREGCRWSPAILRSMTFRSRRSGDGL